MIQRLCVLALMCFCALGHTAAVAFSDYLSPDDQQKAFKRYLCDSNLTQISTLYAASNGFLEGMNMPSIAMLNFGSALVGTSLNTETVISSQEAIDLEKTNPTNSLTVLSASTIAFSTGKALNPITLTTAYFGQSVGHFEFISRLKLPREYFTGLGLGLALGLANSIVDNYDVKTNSIHWIGMLIELTAFGSIGILTSVILAVVRRYAGGIVKYSFMLALEIALPSAYKNMAYKVLYFVLTVILCMIQINLASSMLSLKSQTPDYTSIFKQMDCN